MKKLVLRLLLGVLIIAGIVIITRKPQDQFQAKQIEHQINYAQIKVFDPVYIALDKGYFKDEGVTVNLKGETFGGPQALMAAASGDIDAGIAATTAIINAKASGIKVKGILDVQTAFEDSPLMKWYTLEDSKINNAIDLKGKKIGVNTLGASFHYTTVEYLKKNNISPSDVEFVVIPHGNLEQALRAKQIDVAGMIDPFNEIASDRGGLRVLFTAYDVLGVNQFSLIFMSEDKINSDPEAVIRFTKAYKRAVQFIENNSEQSAAIIADVFKVDKKYIPRHKFQPSATVNENDIKFWLEFMRAQNVKDLDALKFEEIGTNEFNQ